MGDLIVMSRARPVPASPSRGGPGAEILFFTGVRYYRMEEAASPTTQPSMAELAPPKRRRPSQRQPKRVRTARALEMPA